MRFELERSDKLYTDKLSNMITKKGFTLIELLVVIGILAILATATALILNPAELLKQSRDSTRIADMASLSSAIDLYVTDRKDATLGASRCTNLDTAGAAGTKSALGTPTACTVPSGAALRLTDGTGWVSVNLGQISGGSPVSRLPIDPITGTSANASANCGAAGAGCFYQFIGDNTTKKYELDSAMESAKFANTGSADVESTDGGDNANAYEVGPNLVL